MTANIATHSIRTGIRLFWMLLMVLPLPAHAGPWISTGLIAHYNFNEGSGLTTEDASGNGHAATLMNGVGWAEGKFGQSIQLNGTGAYLTVANSLGTLNAGMVSYSRNWCTARI